MVAGEGIGLTIDQVLALRKQQPERFVYIFKPSLNYEHIDLNLDKPLLGDPRLRRAMLVAIDRKTLVDKLFEGMQPVAATWVNPLEEYYWPDATTYPFDPAQAKALLAEAGFSPGTDGICRDASGNRLSFEFSTTAGNRLRELTQQVLQSQWKAACIEVTIKNEPARTLFGETVKRRNFELAMYAWSSPPSQPPRQTLATDSIPTEANNYASSNYPGFSNPLMDADIEMAETELDPAAQRKLWVDMQRIYADKLPALPLFFRAEAHVIPPWLKGYEPTGHSNFGTLWAENWRPG
jgi:peptide/nickel transport system substrate-binding protein